MSILETTETICKFRIWLHGEIEDHTLGALDRMLENVEWLSHPSDSAAVDAAMDEVRSQAQRYANGQLNSHVPALKTLRDADAQLDNPCTLANTWLALDKLDRTLDVLMADNDSGTIDASHRVEALDAAGDAINKVAGLMGESAILAGFGEFLAEFVKTAWTPLTSALGIYFRRLEWISNTDPNTGEILGPQPE